MHIHIINVYAQTLIHTNKLMLNVGHNITLKKSISK